MKHRNSFFKVSSGVLPTRVAVSIAVSCAADMRCVLQAVGSSCLIARQARLIDHSRGGDNSCLGILRGASRHGHDAHDRRSPHKREGGREEKE